MICINFLHHRELKIMTSKVCGVFRENRVLCFASGRFDDFVNEYKNKLNKNDDDENVEKNKQQQENAAVGTFITDAKHLQKLLEELCFESINTKKNALEREVKGVMKRLDSHRVLEAVSKYIVKNIKEKDVKKFAKEKLENSSEETAKQYDTKVDSLRANIQSQTPFSSTEIDIIAEVGVENIISRLNEDVDGALFLKLFAQIENSEDLYESLDADLTNILANDDISNGNKNVIFEKFIDLYIIEERITGETRESLRGYIIREKTMHEFDYIKQLHKNIKTKKESVEELRLDPAREGKNDLVVRNIDLQKKEEEMLNKVRKLLGDEVANGAEEVMNAHEKIDFEQRKIAYFRFIEEEIKPSLKALEKQGIEITREYAEKQEKVLQFALGMMIAYSEKVRKEKQETIKREFGMFHEYLDALSVSEKQNSYIPVLTFLTKGGRTTKQRDAMKNLKIFTEEDLEIIKGIESKRKNFEDLVAIQRLQYSEDTHRINKILESEQFIELQKKDPDCEQRGVGSVFDFVKNKNILTDEGIVAICGKKDALYQPKYFVNANILLGDVGLSTRDLKTVLTGGGDITMTKNIVLKLGKEFSKTGNISKNIIVFFTKNRIESGINDVVNRVKFVAKDVIGYAEGTGKFTEEGISGKLKETYELFKNTSNLVESKIKAMRKVGAMLHTTIENYDGDKKNLYFIAIQEILQELEKNYTTIKEGLENNSLKYMDPETKKFVSLNLHKFINVTNEADKQKRLEFLNAEIKKLAVQYSTENLQNLLDKVDSAFQKDKESKTGGKNLYTVLTGINPEVFKSDKTSIPEKMLFQILSERKGLTKESILVLQDLMNSKNQFDEFFIISGSETKYVPKKNQIVLEEHIFTELQTFDITKSEDVEKLEYSEESQSFQEKLSYVFHEVGHSIFEKNGIMMVRFTNILQQNLKNDYNDFLLKVDAQYKNEKSEDNREELLVEVGSLLQFSEIARLNFLEENSVLDTVFSSVSVSSLETVFNLSSYNDVGTQAGKKNLSLEGRYSEEEEAPDNRTAEVYFEEGSAEQKAEKELEEQKKYNSDFYTDEIKLQKLREFNKIIHGNEEGKYEKEMDNGVLGYIEQLKDSRSDIGGPAGKALDKVIINLEKSVNVVIKYFKDPNKNDTERRANLLIEFAEDLKKNAVGCANELSRLHSPSGNLFSRMWENTRFLSGDNVVDIVKQWWNYFLRRHARKNKERVGAVGAAMATGIAPGLATDFTKQQDSAQDEEVEEFHGAYKMLSDGDLYSEFDNIGNQDSFQAYMEEMSLRGLLNWGRQDDDGNRVYAKKLTSYGSNIRFYENDFLYEGGEESALNNKFQKAFLDVYGDNDLFYSFYSDNTNAIDSKTNDAVSVAAVRGGVPQQILEWLYQHEHDEFVNPNVYEGFVKLMIGDGTTDPANYIYYLIAGVHIGLLDVNVFPRFYGYYGNTFPPFNGIANYTKQDADNAMEAVLKNKDGSFRNIWEEPPEIWVPWVHANVMTIPSTVERTIINLGQKKAGGFDHDNAGLLAAIGSADTGGQMLAQASTGNLETKLTVYSQSIYGQVQNVLNLSNMDYDADNNNFNFEILQKTITRQAGFFSSTDALINSRLDSSKSKFKATEDFLRKPPRGGYGYKDGLGTEEYMKMGRAIYSNVYTPKFKTLAEDFLFAGSYNNNADGLKAKWAELREDSYIKNVIFKGEAVPELKNAASIDQEYSIIVAKIFHHFFTDHPDAKKNVLSVVNAAQDVYFGMGISGVSGSDKWGTENDVPYQFVENYKKERGVDPTV